MDDNLVRFIVFILSGYRAIRLITWDRGPFDILARFRKRLGVEYVESEVGVACIVQDRAISEFIACPWCVGVWVAIGLTILWYVQVLDPLVLALGLAGGISILGEIIER